MNYQEFKKLLTEELPPKNWAGPLKALWYDAKGDWDTAHKIVDGMNNTTAKWIHAYLHRKEGDDWNAGYWYRQAGKKIPKSSLEEEHRELVEYILNN
ncbi:hypothetical protein FEE95_10395 [Maribacter algarum]|uniref:Uncharacterized protein n=1 Tax=Maribacter algarum (ex Zhang et al. 2020) TaxID=2578118 RepID=A0A5S3PVB6_9FLAO|nr:hypothetical protein [Maribacter algarum]TMM56898.1 hypothetical protein FEE95_10395 [Maribacter algarum]